MADKIVRVQDGFVFRKGSNTNVSMTPRPGEDVSPDLQKAGLSTWRDLEAAIPVGGKGQKIDVAKLDSAVLGCYQDEAGHVSIVPIDKDGGLDMIKLAEWAATRGSATLHPFTMIVVNAIVERDVWRTL